MSKKETFTSAREVFDTDTLIRATDALKDLHSAERFICFRKERDAAPSPSEKRLGELLPELRLVAIEKGVFRVFFPKHPPNRADPAKLESLRKAGFSVTTIGHVLDVSRSLVYSHVKTVRVGRVKATTSGDAAEQDRMVGLKHVAKISDLSESEINDRYPYEQLRLVGRALRFLSESEKTQ
jgi:hypothetical protein